MAALAIFDQTSRSSLCYLRWQFRSNLHVFSRIISRYDHLRGMKYLEAVSFAESWTKLGSGPCWYSIP